MNRELTRMDRRGFLRSQGMGMGSVALAWLLQREGLLGAPVRPELAPVSYDLKPKHAGVEPQAKAMISLFMQGGPSHIDLFDPKPELEKYDGQAFPGKIKYDNAAQASSKVLASPWAFERCGESGMEVSELLPYFKEIVDDVTLVRSMHTGVNNHGQSIHAMNSGRIRAGNPALGSWMTYALGCETDQLPAFVALTDPKGVPVEGVKNWSNGWLPSIYQGTVIRSKEPRIANLGVPEKLRGAPQRGYLDFLGELNRGHLQRHPGEEELEARIASYELAAHMQTAALEAMDLSGESEATKKLYGLDEEVTREYGTRCLLARRLVERGVRFVQVYTKNQFWDHHGGILNNLPAACRMTDKPAAALVKDLKSRGLLDSTVVHWGGEMGRLPVIQNDTGRSKIGRDHNTYGFGMWLAGGGVRRGHVHGATDEFGHHAVEGVVTHGDYHATLLSLFGIDHEQLVFMKNGRGLSLTDGKDVRVVGEMLG
ncbi:MAG: DUF1501 domain-containing protein [Verrucomicrobiales bacterium]|nr:DUF1501 domain-containing protein [Verrucomicrobiales bacterium]